MTCRAVASWLVHSTPDRAVRVLALAGDIVFLSKTLYSRSNSPLQRGNGEFNDEE